MSSPLPPDPNIRAEILEIVTYHGDEGTSGYLISYEHVDQILALFKTLIESSKPEIKDHACGFNDGKFRCECYQTAQTEYETNLLKGIDL